MRGSIVVVFSDLGTYDEESSCSAETLLIRGSIRSDVMAFLAGKRLDSVDIRCPYPAVVDRATL